MKAREQSGGKAIGWHISSVMGRTNRSIVADEVVNLAWYDAYEVPISEHGAVDEIALAIVNKELMEMLRVVSNFLNEVIINYCEQNDLVVTGVRPDWVDANHKFD